MDLKATNRAGPEPMSLPFNHLSYFEQVQKYLDLQKDKVVVKYFNLTPQIDPISSMVSKLSITVQFVPVEFLPFSRLVVSFNNTLPAFS